MFFNPSVLLFIFGSSCVTLLVVIVLLKLQNKEFTKQWKNRKRFICFDCYWPYKFVWAFSPWLKTEGEVNREITTAEAYGKYCGRFADWILTSASRDHMQGQSIKPTLRDPSEGHSGSITSLPVDVFVIGAQINILDLQSIIERDTLHFRSWIWRSVRVFSLRSVR